MPARRKKSARKKSGRKTTARKTSARKKTGRKNSSGREVEHEMHEFKRGEAHSGRSGQKVKSRKQAIAIGLSKARKKGERIPPNPNE